MKCSQTLYDDIAKHGGKPVVWKTGHSLIKTKMKETGAMLAGEMSGHIFFADRYFGYDDAIYAGLRLLEILAKDPRPLSEMLADVPKTFSTPELRVDCPDAIKFQVVAAVTASLQGEGQRRARHRRRAHLLPGDGQRAEVGPRARVQHRPDPGDALRGRHRGRARRDPQRGRGRRHRGARQACR